jgi:hypothetical protein
MTIGKMLTAGALALATLAPAAAQTSTVVVHKTTTVSNVHGPLKVIPHHNRKVCRVYTVHHRTTRRCHYR